MMEKFDTVYGRVVSTTKSGVFAKIEGEENVIAFARCGAMIGSRVCLTVRDPVPHPYFGTVFCLFDGLLDPEPECTVDPLAGSITQEREPVAA
jgi:hypothetical protein